MRVWLEIGKAVVHVDADVYVCNHCGRYITCVFDGMRCDNPTIIAALKNEGAVIRVNRPCSRHPGENGRRAM